MLEKKVTTKFKKLYEWAKVPEYASDGDSGADVFSAQDITIRPGERQLVGTGIAIALPQGHEAQIRPKSGLALNFGMTVLNAPGTVDEGYRGEVGVVLFNTSDEDFVITKGQKIAQMVIKPVYQSNFVEVEELDETVRGEGGFGSTGL